MARASPLRHSHAHHWPRHNEVSMAASLYSRNSSLVLIALFPLSLSPTGVTPSLCSSPWRQAFARHTSSSEPPPSSEPRTLRAFAWSSVPRLGQPPAPGPPTSKGQNATLGIAVAFHKSTPLFQGECERMRLMRAEAFFTGRRGREFEESMYNTRGLERRGTKSFPI